MAGFILRPVFVATVAPSIENFCYNIKTFRHTISKIFHVDVSKPRVALRNKQNTHNEMCINHHHTGELLAVAVVAIVVVICIAIVCFVHCYVYVESLSKKVWQKLW